MVHLLHHLYGVDAPDWVRLGPSVTCLQKLQPTPRATVFLMNLNNHHRESFSLARQPSDWIYQQMTECGRCYNTAVNHAQLDDRLITTDHLDSGNTRQLPNSAGWITASPAST